MATTYTTQANKINEPQTYGFANPSEIGGSEKIAFFSKTCASEAISDVIRLTKLPAGARVLGIVWTSEDLSSGSATLDIGDSSDTDRFVIDVAVGAGAIATGNLTLRTPTTETPDIGLGYKYSSDTWIQALVKTAALNTGKFWGFVRYVVD